MQEKIEQPTTTSLVNTDVKYDILIICDEENDFQFFKKVLRADYNLFYAENLEKTIDILKSFSTINVVIIVKKEFNDILNYIKAHPYYYSVPIIACFDFDNYDGFNNAVKFDVTDIWRKPLIPDLATFKIKRIVDQNSVIDKKTGLLCQEAFLSRAEKILTQNLEKTYYAIRFDIENFKIFNHAYGVSEGDKLLAYIGEKANALTTKDSIFCRWERDHFMGLVEERYLSSKNIIRYFTQMQQTLHPEYKLYMRMGLYKVTDHNMPVAQMCDKAFLAHKFSKKDGSSFYAFYDSRLLDSQLEEQKITEDMEKALEEEQFVVYLQPQYNQVSMKLYGAEALVRWIHPEKGLIKPSSFIPLFEKNGFILKLDRYVFRKVCSLQRKWIDEGVNVVPISVNLSRAEAQNPNLCDELLNILEEYHLTTKYINLEITESAYMDNPYQVVSLAKRLQEAGFELEMDDFGSGYSSLNTLKEIPVDVLKLDLKFLYGEDESNRTSRILSSIIRMAHGMSMPIIAEGVETKEQANFLKSLGCFYIQGFYFDRPMPAEDFKNRLNNYYPDIVKNNRFKTAAVEGQKLDVSSLLSDFFGPAGIIEYDEQRIEGARFNNAFFELLNIDSAESFNCQVAVQENFSKEDYQIFVNTAERAITTKETCECELKLKKKANSNRPTWIRLKLTFLSSHEHIYTFYGRIEDIDEEKNRNKDFSDIVDSIYALSDCLPGGTISLLYENGEITKTYASEGIATMIGISLTQYLEATKDDIMYFVHPEDKPLLQIELKKILEEAKTYVDVAYRLLHKNGEFINVHLFAKIFHKPDGSKKGVAAILNADQQIQNIQYSLQLEQENNELQQKLIALTKNKNPDMLEGLFSKKPKTKTAHLSLEEHAFPLYELAEEYGHFSTFRYSGLTKKFIDMSPNLPKIFGYTRQEFFKKFNDNMDNFIWKEDRKKVLAKMQQDLNKENTNGDLCIEHRVQTKNGELKWVRSRARKIVEHDGSEYYIGAIIDISVERGIYKTLDAQKFTIDSLENNTEGATIRWFISGNKWTVDFASKYNETIFGTSLNELLEAWKTNPYQYAHPYDASFIKREALASIKNGTIHKLTYRIVRHDGSIRWLRSCGQYYPLGKDEGYFVVTCYDITDQLEAENQVIEEKHRLQSFIDALPGGAVWYEIRPDNLKVNYLSGRVAKMFGKTKEEFINAVEDNKDLGIFEKDSAKVLSAIKRLEQTGEPFKVDFRVKHKDGYLVWATVNAVKSGENNGNPTFVAIYQNKTENTNTLDQILSRISFYVVVFDATTKDLLYVNPNTEVLTNKHFDVFNPVHVSEFLYNKKLADLDNPVPEDFDKDEYTCSYHGKKLLVKRFRIDWNGHDAIFAVAEEIIKN